MISLPIRDQSGQQVGTYDFDPHELAKAVNRQLLHDAVVMYEANRRVGTARTKSRGEIAGSTKKIYRQKGTGRARMGPKRTPVRRGGGHAFRKVPRDWGYRMPRRQVQLATRMAILSKFLDNEVTLVDRFTLEAPKTKAVAQWLKNLGVADRTCLIATEQHDPVVYKSARNIPTVRVSPAADLNAYEVLHQRQLVLTKGALDGLRSRAQAQASAPAAP